MASRAVLSRIPRVAWGLIAAQLLCILLLVFSLAHGLAEMENESMRAAASMQRLVIDAKTGIITSTGQVKPQDALGTVPAFDVAPAKKSGKASPTSKILPPAKSSTPAQPSSKTTPTPVASAAPHAPSFVLDVAEPALATIPRQNASLVMAPAPEVSEQTPEGILPKRSAGKSTPASLYARPYRWKTAEEQPPSVAILVIGLGLNARGMEAALQLPPEVSFSFSPYGEQVPLWLEWARNAGHEAWIDLPAQTEAFPVDDPGPLGIFNPMKEARIKKNFHKLLLLGTGYIGFALPAAQTVLTEPELLSPIVKELDARGLLLAVPTSAVAPASLPHLAPLKQNLLLADMLADQEIDENFIRARLSRLEDQARAKRTAFAVIRAHPMALRLIGEWAKTLPAKKIELVPVSALSRIPKVKP